MALIRTGSPPSDRTLAELHMNIVKFLNWTDSDFTWSWNGVPYTFPKGESIMMEDWKAEHFSKHLIDRELHAEGLQVCDEKRAEYLKMTLIDTEVNVGSQGEADNLILNQRGEEVGSELSPQPPPPGPSFTPEPPPVAPDIKPCCGAKKFAHHKADCPKNDAAAAQA